MKKKLTTLMTVCVVLIGGGLLPSVLQAQVRQSIDVQEWPTGKVVLVNGDTLYGTLTYYRTPDIVNVSHEDGSMTSVSPVNVEYFVAQEMPSGKSYTFRTLFWDMGKPYSDFKKPTFFEVLNQGALTLIKREAYSQGNANTANATVYEPVTGSSPWASDHIRNLYYILLPNGEIVSLKNLRKDLQALFGNKYKDVKSYIKLNKLDYEKPHELVAIVNYFNTLSGSTSLAY